MLKFLLTPQSRVIIKKLISCLVTVLFGKIINNIRHTLFDAIGKEMVSMPKAPEERNLCSKNG
jgi:hypothetical protein